MVIVSVWTQHLATEEQYEPGIEIRIMANQDTDFWGWWGLASYFWPSSHQAVSPWVDAFLAIVFLSCLFHILLADPDGLGYQERATSRNRQFRAHLPGAVESGKRSSPHRDYNASRLSQRGSGVRERSGRRVQVTNPSIERALFVER